MESKNIYSESFSNRERHFFIDMKRTAKGNLYLKITRSDQSVDGSYNRSSIIIFEEDFECFITSLSSVFHHTMFS
ncbi:DUF3276 family protein [Pedobacter agri]|uniref:DUF3276 family protein n=1 Tax=Pedobacter agri TaxID=454586 RepID=A0A9X3DHN3_9SPHI|nr:DUF3276 family protein [Pedobacter agri]MCX3265638.1 DUF3276 family protein [Pedobacter agri]